ncbi:ABC transporter permease [Kineosporia succinea]|uniref:Simple sugar transport system permease protein n=1 Tax=Kineosporia succinea TaxID=84632 RepID=A0ABT9P575_9ACTN|nr:ABC transporter permease [Kineosporia succinea]MDP9827340.1 simple sugar transport system permease protein [Kineosporia succinea]
MTATLEETTAPEAKAGLSRPVRITLYVVVGLVVLSLIRVITGATDLTSNGTVSAALMLAVPIGLAGLGGLWSERAGVVNIGLEGMMILGTFGAGWIGWQHGPWAGVLMAVAFGAIGGLVHAVATVTFGVDHVVSGVAINILGLGATQYLAGELLADTPGGGETQSPQISGLPKPSVPGLTSVLEPLESHHWFLLSDLAGILRGLLTNVSILTIISILLVIATYVILWQTPFGLRLRSVGEDPHAAESLGVKVRLYKYVAVVVSGGLAGLAGAFLAIVASSLYREGQTGGRGYIGLAAMIFGNWRPGGLVAGAGLFGYTDAMQLRNATAVHALLLVVFALLLVVTALNLYRRRWVTAGVGLVFAVLSLVWYLATDELPGPITTMTPYVTTLLVLALAAQHLRMPKADGLVYRPEGK